VQSVSSSEVQQSVQEMRWSYASPARDDRVSQFATVIRPGRPTLVSGTLPRCVTWCSKPRRAVRSVYTRR